MSGKVFNIQSDMRKVIQQYLHITKPFHHMSPAEINLTAEFVHEFLSRRKDFRKVDDCWEKVFHHTTKREIRERLEMEPATLQTVISRLRKKKVIQGNTVAGQYIPAVQPGKAFDLLFRFQIDG